VPDRPLAEVVDLAQARARRGVKVGRGQLRRVNPGARPAREERRPGFLIPVGTAVRLVELVDGDVVAVDKEGKRTWHARIGFVAERIVTRRQPRRRAA
jgi:hypothetical protein